MLDQMSGNGSRLQCMLAFMVPVNQYAVLDIQRHQVALN
jgi:hypothetical protein